MPKEKGWWEAEDSPEVVPLEEDSPEAESGPESAEWVAASAWNSYEEKDSPETVSDFSGLLLPILTIVVCGYLVFT